MESVHADHTGEPKSARWADWWKRKRGGLYHRRSTRGRVCQTATHRTHSRRPQRAGHEALTQTRRLSERPRNREESAITVAQPEEEFNPRSMTMWLVESIEEWCKSADDSLTRVLVVWDFALNGLIAREISPRKSNDFL